MQYRHEQVQAPSLSPETSRALKGNLPPSSPSNARFSRLTRNGEKGGCVFREYLSLEFHSSQPWWLDEATGGPGPGFNAALRPVRSRSAVFGRPPAPNCQVRITRATGTLVRECEQRLVEQPLMRRQTLRTRSCNAAATRAITGSHSLLESCRKRRPVWYQGGRCARAAIASRCYSGSTARTACQARRRGAPPQCRQR